MDIQKKHISGYSWTILSLPWALMALSAMLNFSIGVLLSPMENDVGFNTIQAGYLSSVSWFLTVLLMFPITSITNRFGTRKVMSLIFFIVGIAVLLQGLASTYPMLLIARMFALGISVGIVPVVSLLKKTWIPMENITTISGVESLMNPIGQILATLLIPIILANFVSWRVIFSVTGMIILGVGITWLLISKNDPSGDKGTGNSSVVKIDFSDFFQRYKTILLLGLAVSGTSFVWTAFFTFWPSYATDNLQIPITTAGFILSTFPVGSVIASLIMPEISTRAGIEKPFIWAWGFVLPVLYYGMLTTTNLFLLTFWAFMAGFGAFAFVPFSMSMPFKIPEYTTAEVSVASGIMMMFTSIASGFGPIVASQIFQASGSLYLALSICCLFPLTLGLLGLLAPERGRLELEKRNSIN